MYDDFGLISRYDSLYSLDEGTRDRLLGNRNPFEAIEDPAFTSTLESMENMPEWMKSNYISQVADDFTASAISHTSARKAMGELWKRLEGKEERAALYDYLASPNREADDYRAQIDRALDWMIRRDLGALPSDVSYLTDEMKLLREDRGAHNNLLDAVTGPGGGYISRPGILPTAAFFDSATKEIFIDIYQYQNPSLVNLQTVKLLQMATSNEGGRVVIRMARPTETTDGDNKNYDILGPNLITYRRFEYIKQLIGDRVDIELQWADRRSHPKFLLSDSAAMIGSMNLTDPLGQTTSQAGSNVEFIRVLRTNLSSEESKSVLNATATDAEVDSIQLSREDKLYLQARASMDKLLANQEYDPVNKLLTTGMPNIAGTLDTYEHLRDTVDYLQRHPTLAGEGRPDLTGRLYFILNQVFLLEHESTLLSKQLGGEMGTTSDAERIDIESRSGVTTPGGTSPYDYYIQEKARHYSELQSKILNLVIDDRAHIAVDVHTYRERVEEPVFNLLRGNRALDAELYNLNYDIRRFTSGHTVSSLTDELVKYGFYEGDITKNEQLSRQLLAMTSGNIEVNATPRSHVKAFLAVYENQRGESNVLTGSQGSSNYGVNSLTPQEILDKYGDMERLSVNQELNLIVRSNVMGVTNADNSILSLSDEEQQLEQEEYARAFFNLQGQLGVRQVGSQYNIEERRSMFSSRVDRRALLNLADQLELINKSIGTEVFKVQRNFNNFNLSDIEVGVSGARTYKFGAYLNASGEGEASFIAINEGRQIESALLFNQGTERWITGITRGDDEIAINPRGREKLSPSEVVIGLLSTIALESETTRLIKTPAIEYQRYWSPATTAGTGVIRADSDLITGAMFLLKDVMGVNDWFSGNEDGKIERGVARIRQLLLMEGSTDIDRIRQFAGVNANSPDRLSAVNSLSDALLSITRNIDAAGEPITDVVAHRQVMMRAAINQLYEMMDKGPDFADLTYLFVNAQRGGTYSSELKESLKGIHERAFSSFLTPTQARAYGSTQAQDRLLAFGFNEGHEALGLSVVHQAVKRIRAGERQFNNLAAYAILSSPFNVGPTSDLGEGETKLFVRVAEGNAVADRDESNIFASYPGILPYVKSSAISEVFNLNLMRSTAVGSIMERSAIEDYLADMVRLGIDEATVAGMRASITELFDKTNRDSIYRFYFDPGKPDQIPQRLKNVIGSRPLMDISEGYTSVLESGEYTYTPKFGGAATNIQSPQQYQEAYINDLRAGLRALGLDDSVVTNDYKYGAIFGGRIQRFFSSDSARELELIKKQLAEQVGVSPDSISNDEDDVLSELFRATLVQVDLFASRERRFLGASKPLTAMILALDGGFSDYAYANPMYQVRRGYLDSTTKSVKGSLLQEGWTFNPSVIEEAGQTRERISNLLVSTDDRIMFDELENKYYLYDKDGNKKQAITSRGEMRVLMGVMEATSRLPNYGAAAATSSAFGTRGESAIEQILQVARLKGSDATNEVQVQLQLLRTLVEGGGRRVEGERGLAKIVPVFLDAELFTTEVYGAVKQGGYHSDIDIKDIQYVVSPTNLKSYAFSHGAALLTNEGGKLFTRGVLNQDSRMLATALLLIGSLDRFSNRTNISKEAVASKVGELAINGELGTFFTDIALSSGKGDALTIGNRIISRAQSMDADARDLGLRTPALQAIDLSDIMLALETGSSTELRETITQIVDLEGAQQKGYIETGALDIRGYERAAIAGNLEIVLQLMNRTNRMRLVTTPYDDSAIGRHAYSAMGSIAGVTRGMEEAVGQDAVALMLDQLSNYSNYVIIYNAVLGSHSKPPLSKKDTAQLEAQHILSEPFVADAERFKRTGDLQALRKTVTSIMSMVIPTEPSSLKGINPANIYDLSSSDFYTNITLTKALLGVYENAFRPLNEREEITTRYADALMYRLLSRAGIEENIQRPLRTKLGLSETATLSEVRSAANDRFYEVENELYRYAAEYRLEGNKILGIERSEAIIGSMRNAGLKRIAFSFPTFITEGRDAMFNTSQPEYSLVLSPEDIRAMGVQYGSHISEVANSTIAIWSALAPGSAVREIFMEVARRKAAGETNIRLDNLSEYQAAELLKFQELTQTYEQRVAKELSGQYLQQITGNKIKVEGSTTVGAASWFVPLRSAVLAQAMTDRFSDKGSITRENLLRVSSEYLRANPLDRESTTPEIHRLTRDLVRSQMVALTDGLSIAGMYQLERLVSSSRQFQKRIDMIGEDVTALKEDLTNTIAEYEKMKLGGQGDNMVASLGVAEFSYLLASLDKKEWGAAEQDNYKRLAEVPVIVAGLAIGQTTDIDRISIQYNEKGERIDNMDILQGRIRKSSVDLSFSDISIGDTLDVRVNSFKTFARRAISIAYSRLAELESVEGGLGPEYNLKTSSLRKRIEAIEGIYNTAGANLDAELIKNNPESKKVNDYLTTYDMTLRADLNIIMSEVELTKAMIFRSPPPGNIHMSQLVFGLQSLESINKLYQDTYGGASFFDDKRNRTLSLLNPISFIVSNLGDFDGDTFSAVFYHLSELELRETDLELRINSAKDTLSRTDDPEETRLLKQRLGNLERSIVDVRRSIDAVKRNEDWGRYTDAVTTWVADYMKLDKDMLSGQEMGTLLTYVEQARGLFGMMDDVYASIHPAHQDIVTLLNERKTQGAVDIVNNLSSRTDLRFFGDLLSDNSTRAVVEEHLLEILGRDNHADRERDAYDFLGRLSSDNAFKNLYKYMGRSHGSALTDGEFEMMQKAIGQAGSIVLGKTYNSTIGLLYEQAPILAVGSAVEHDSRLQEIVVEQLILQGRSEQDARTDLSNLISAAEVARGEAGKVGGFLQEVHQLLRDAIKPKSSGQDFFNQLSEYHRRYVEADDKDVRKGIVEEMSKLVPISPLLNLDAFINNYRTLIDDSDSDKVSSDVESLLSRFNIDGAKEDTLIERIESITGDTIGSRRRALVVSYQLRQDMTAMATTFAFDRAFNEGKGTGRGLLELVSELTGPMANRIDTILSGDDSPEALEFRDFISTNFGSDRFNSLGEGQRLLAMNFLRTRESTALWAGEAGEKLFDFAALNNTRSLLYGKEVDKVLGDNVIASSSSPLMKSILQTLQAGKVDDPHMASMLLESIADAMEHGDGTKYGISDVMKTLLSNGTLTNNSVGRDMIEMVMRTVLNTQEGTDLLRTHLRATMTGQQVETVMALSEGVSGYESKDSTQRTIDTLVEMGLSKEEAKRYESRTRQLILEDNVNIDLLGDRHTIPQKPSVTRSSNLIADRLPILNERGGQMLETILFPVLALAGAAISTGGVSPEAVQQFTGDTLMAMAYQRPPGLNTGIGMAIGAGFKGRLASQLHENPAVGLGMLVAQEVGYGLTAQFAGRYLINPIIERTLGKAPSLDIDPFAGVRSIVSNVLTGALSLATAGLINKSINAGIERAISMAYAPAAVDTISAQLRASREAMVKERLEMASIEGEYEVEDVEGRSLEWMSGTATSDSDYDTYETLYATSIDDEGQAQFLNEEGPEAYSFTYA